MPDNKTLTARALALHQDALVIEGSQSAPMTAEHFARLRRGGIHALNITAVHNIEAEFAQAAAEIQDLLDTIRAHPETLEAIEQVVLRPTHVPGPHGRYVVASGPDVIFDRVLAERHGLRIGDEVEVIGLGAHKKTVITGAEMFRKELDEVQAGDNAGLLLRGIEKNELERGMVIAKPGSITPHKKFTAQVYVLKKEEGGRHTPFFTGYRPQFYFRTTDVTGVSTLPGGTEMVMPGDNMDNMAVELISPIAMEEGLRFAIREGGHTVGAGVVTKIIE